MLELDALDHRAFVNFPHAQMRTSQEREGCAKYQSMTIDLTKEWPLVQARLHRQGAGARNLDDESGRSLGPLHLPPGRGDGNPRRRDCQDRDAPGSFSA